MLMQMYMSNTARGQTSNKVIKICRLAVQSKYSSWELPYTIFSFPFFLLPPSVRMVQNDQIKITAVKLLLF